ncbi:MAG: NAD(P)/FAD-dependent oxidoreductase, partial [Marmoricola sp.]
MSEHDVVVIGGGAAGLSAGLVLSRARRRVVVVDADAPRNAPAAHMHGFLSRDSFSPTDLLTIGRREVESYGAVLVEGRVSGAVPVTGPGTGPRFRVSLSDGTSFSARRVLVATGLRDELPDIEGVHERWGRDLLHCPYCHGYEVRDQPLAVLGGSPDAVAHAQLIRQWSADVALFPHTDTLTTAQREQLAARAIEVVEGPVRRLVVVDGRLSGVELEDGRVVDRTAVFVRPVFVPNNDVLVALGAAMDEHGWVVADVVGATSVAGVWVAGNVGNPRAQVITAAGEGSAAAIAINADLVEEEVSHAITDLAWAGPEEFPPAPEGVGGPEPAKA